MAEDTSFCTLASKPGGGSDRRTSRQRRTRYKVVVANMDASCMNHAMKKKQSTHLDVQDARINSEQFGGNNINNLHSSLLLKGLQTCDLTGYNDNRYA